MNENLERARAALGFISPLLARHRMRLLAGFLCLVAVDLLQLLIPRVTKRAFDGLSGFDITGAELFTLGLFLIGLALVTGVCRFGWRYLVLGFSRILEREFRAGLVDHLLRLDRTFYQRHTTGDIMALASNDLAAVQLAFGMGLIAFADALFMGAATLGFMAYIHPRLALYAVLPMPVLAAATMVLSARLHRRFKLVQEQFGRLTEFARTSLTTIRLIKAYTQEGAQAARFDRIGRDYIAGNLKLAAVHGTLWPFSGLAASASLLMVVYFGGRLTIAGTITVGDFVAFMSYLYMMTWPMMALGWVTNLFQRGVTSVERLQAVFQARPALQDPPGAAGMPGRPESLALRGLTFRYPGEERPALREITVDFSLGLHGVTGRTGCGKTTLCQVLARLYPLETGRYFADGVDVTALPIAWYRDQLAYVPQDVVLFADTIRANIAFGLPDADQAAVEEAARLVMMHEEILSMPEGYLSKIGERGVQLSGGQRQRIALARALLLDRPILIIDDGLSAVDTETEHAIISNMAPRVKARVCVFVSHRLAPFAGADSILVMADGSIAAQGRHEELLEENAYYRTVYRHQAADGP